MVYMNTRTFYHCIDCGKQLTYQGKKQKVIRCRSCNARWLAATCPTFLKNGFKKGNQFGTKFVKGQAPTAGSFQKGHEFDFETWLKIKKANLGRHHSKDTEFKDGGKNCESTKLKDWKNQVFLRDNWTCTECGQHRYVQVHHIKSWKEYPELRFVVSNGTTLCPKHHKAKHNRRHLTGSIKY